MAFDATDITLSFLKIGIVLALLLNVTPIMVWVERRGSAPIQDRVGPNRVGPFGLLQSFADALKFILKEDMVPARAHKVLYTLAPTFGLIPAVTTVAVATPALWSSTESWKLHDVHEPQSATALTT